MDGKRFDRLTRMLSRQTHRRGIAKVAAGGALSVVGLNALSRAALGQDVSAESQGYKGDDCFDNSDCRQGLKCDQDKQVCQYPRNCGGKKNAACQGDAQCCKNKNLECKNKKCRRRKKKKN
jgi:hypothetical protein